jgi:hypothetical protein
MIMRTLLRNATTVVVLATVVLGFAACGGGRGAGAPDGRSADAARDAGVPADGAVVAVVDAALDAGPSRPYHLAATGTALDPTRGLVFTDADLATDADVVSLHVDFGGLPWDAFATNGTLPPAWVASMDALAARTRALGKEVFLSLAPLDGARRTLAADVVVDASGEHAVSDWKPACYDLATAPDGAALRLAYGRYVAWMVHEFAPRWVNAGIEVTMFMSCGAAWDGLVALENDAYDAAHAARAGLIVFPSIQLDALYGRTSACPSGMTPDQCFEANYARLAGLKRDRFAISTYPYGAGFATPADLPADWFTRAADRGGERLVFAEIGWLATPLVADDAGTCVLLIDASASAQGDYLDLVIATATARDVDLVTWWSDRDFLPAAVVSSCPCTADVTYCGVIAGVRAAAGADPAAQFAMEALFKYFGAMGLRGIDGTPRQPIFDRWQAARALPIR